MKRIIGNSNLRNFGSSANATIQKFEDIPGPTPIPIFGTLYQYLPIIGRYKFDRLHWNGEDLFRRYGPIVREEIIPGVNVVWLFDPNDFEVMFRSEGRYPQRRSHLALQKFRMDNPNIYNTGGLLPTNGEDWFRLRTIFQKGLSSPQCVHNFLPQVNEVMQDFMIRVKLLSKKNNVDYMPELSRLFLELTSVAAFDVRLNVFSKGEMHRDSRSSKLMEAALVTNSCILKTDNGPQLWKKFPTPLYRKLRKAQEYMGQVAIDLVNSKISLYEDNRPSRQLSLLQGYLASPELDLKDIIGIACDLLLAGIDTSTYSTAFILYHLAKHPEAQENLYKECARLLPSPFSPVTKEILAEANYSKAVLKESLRLRPISIGVGRVLDCDAVFSGYLVPKGTVVVTQNLVACRQQSNFAKPNAFIPERWIRKHELYTQPHPFLLLPFGHGPRSCIARRFAEQNMLITMMKLVRSFKIDWDGPEIDTLSLLIQKPDGPINLTFKSRNGRIID